MCGFLSTSAGCRRIWEPAARWTRTENRAADVHQATVRSTPAEGPAAFVTTTA